uniref:Uncharacterized protein n=1 Tax=Parascaris equorum TaxID=6256 RepID=A0A914RG08_PAREQ
MSTIHLIASNSKLSLIRHRNNHKPLDDFHLLFYSDYQPHLNRAEFLAS